MACLDSSCEPPIPHTAGADGDRIASESSSVVLLPQTSAVYKYDLRALGYGEHWKMQGGGSALGAWCRKLARSESLSIGRVVHIEDHRAIEVEADHLPTDARETIWPLLEEYLELGFTEPRFTSYSDPFNQLEVISAQAVQPEVSVVVRITRSRRIDSSASPELRTELCTVYPDGSALVTTSDSPKLQSPPGEKRQGNEGAAPSELWAMHTQVLSTIPYRPKLANDAETGWELVNEIEAERARFNLARGVYAKRSVVECANDQARLLGTDNRWSDAEYVGNSPRSAWRGALIGFAWLLAVIAFIVTICMAAISDKIVKTPPMASAPARPNVPESTVPKAAENKPQPRFARTASPRLRDAE